MFKRQRHRQGLSNFRLIDSRLNRFRSLFIAIFLMSLHARLFGQCGEAARDFCSSARVLSGAPGTQEVVMGVASATPDIAPTCSVNAGHGVWFVITPTVSGLLTFSTCDPATSYDTIVQAYTGDCEFLTPVQCVDDSPGANCDNGCSGSGSIVELNVTAGTTYRFQVSSFNQNSGGCGLCLGVLVTLGAQCGENPSDFCQIPRVLPGSIGDHFVEMDATYATSDISPNCGGSNVGRTVWFQTTPQVDGPVTFSTCTPETTFDTVVQVWQQTDVSCGSLLNVTCNDDDYASGCDNACSGQASTVTFNGTAGATYLFQVGSFDDNASQCSLCLGATLTIAECANDTDCADGNDCTRDICFQGECSNPPSTAGTACGDPTNTPCNRPDTCNGAGTCLANVLPPGTTCADDGNPCTNDQCDTRANCAHTGKPDGTSCGSPNSTDCDNPDTCLNSQCQSNFVAAGTGCSSDGNSCTNDICNGTGSCTHPAVVNGTACGSAADSDCDNPDSCLNGQCAVNHEPFGAPCPMDANDCTLDICNDSGSCTHPIAPAGMACGNAGTSPCDAADSCDGVGNCQPNPAPSGTPCPDSLFCNGAESCDGEGTCRSAVTPCASNESCDESTDHCYTDCNHNLVLDSVDIENGTSLDCNSNGIPDECDPDLDGDGVPDVCDNCPDVANADQIDSDVDGVGDGCIVDCYSCADCTSKLDGRYEVVRLAHNLSNEPGHCILISANTLVFDCQGFEIDGDRMGEFDIGISLINRSGDTIKNCKVRDFATGILVQNSSTNTLLNNELSDNYLDGIFLNGANVNILRGNTLQQNARGLRILASNNNTLIDNTLCNQDKEDILGSSGGAGVGNTRNGNKCDRIFNFNGDGETDWCDTVCTPNQATLCTDAASCQTAIAGGYNQITLDNDILVPGGFSFGANHVILDCNDHRIAGSGSGTGVNLENKINVTVRHCKISNFGVGAELRSSTKCTAQYNTIEVNNEGLRVSNPNGLDSRFNIVADNKILDNTVYGVSILDVPKTSVIRNHFARNQQYSIWLTGSCDQDISNNTSGDLFAPIFYQHDIPIGGSIAGNTYSQIIYCNVGHAAIQNVTINNGTTRNNGILLIDSSPMQVDGANLVNTNGIYAVGSPFTTIKNSTIESSKTHAIRLENSAFSDIDTNSISSNPGFGVVVDTGSDDTEVHGNMIHDNYAGIRVHSAGTCQIHDNMLDGNKQGTPGTGIEVEASANASITNNEVSDSTLGLFFYNTSSNSTVTGNHFCYSRDSDVYNNGTGNTGSGNTCSNNLYRWDDTGAVLGCSENCVGWYNQQWGYSFHNPTKDSLSWTRYKQTFGEDETNITIPICIGLPVCIPFVGCKCLGKSVHIPTPVPDPLAVAYYYALYRSRASDGSCYGMSGTSLQFFRHHDVVSSYDPSASRVRQLQVNSSYHGDNLAVTREIIHGSQVSAEGINHYLSELAQGHANANWVSYKASVGLANRNQGMVSIKDGITTGHVLCYDSEISTGPQQERLVVYDNNKENFVNTIVTDPLAYPAIVIDFSTNNWEYDKGGGVVWGDDMIFDIPYSLVHRSDWSLPTSLDGLATVIFGGSSGNIEDMNGKMIGFDVAGQEHEEIPLGMGFPVYASDGVATLPIPLPMPLVQPGDYNVNTYGNAGDYTAILTGFGGAFVVENTPSSAHDTLEFRRIDGSMKHGSLSFQTSDTGKPVNLLLFLHPGPDKDRRLFEIAAQSVGQTSKLLINATPDQNSLVLTNKGTNTIQYDVRFQNEMTRLSAYVEGVIPQAQLTGQTIPPGTTHILTPNNWGGLSQSSVGVTSHTCGDGVCDTGEHHVNCPADCGEPTCTVPSDDMIISADTRLCPGTYELTDAGPEGVLIVDPNVNGITLDCAGATLIGTGSGTGIMGAGSDTVTIRNCQVHGFAVGVNLDDSIRAYLTDSDLENHSDRGVSLRRAFGATLRFNFITGNAIGVDVDQSQATGMHETLLCPNTQADILGTVLTGVAGSNNACDNPGSWNDRGATGCTFTCALADSDLDGDGVLVDVDNCPSTFNPDQQDSDFDGVGDHCDCCRFTDSGEQVTPSGCAAFDLGDIDGDAIVGLNDWRLMAGCVTGPDSAPDPTCTLSDLTVENHVDLLDVAVFQTLGCKP